MNVQVLLMIVDGNFQRMCVSVCVSVAAAVGPTATLFVTAVMVVWCLYGSTILGALK